MKIKSICKSTGIAAIIALTACSDNDSTDFASSINKQLPVAFKTNVSRPQTKGTQLINLNGKSFALYVYSGINGFALNSDEIIKSGMIMNVDHAGICDYADATDQLFWPETNKLSFYGYAPLNAAGVSDITPDMVSETTPPSFSFVVQDNVIDQIDLLLVRAEEQSHEISNTVALPFRHALSKVTVQARTETVNYQIQITDIQIKQVLSSGKFEVVSQNNPVKYQNTSWKLTPDDSQAPKDYTAKIDFNGLDNSADSAVIINTGSIYSPVTDPQQPMLLLPQTLSENAVMEITYSIINNKTNSVILTKRTESIRLNANAANVTVWNQSQAINYRITFNSSSSGPGSPISFSVSVSDWTTSSNVDYND